MNDRSKRTATGRLALDRMHQSCYSVGGPLVRRAGRRDFPHDKLPVISQGQAQQVDVEDCHEHQELVLSSSSQLEATHWPLIKLGPMLGGSHYGQGPGHTGWAARRQWPHQFGLIGGTKAHRANWGRGKTGLGGASEGLRERQTPC